MAYVNVAVVPQTFQTFPPLGETLMNWKTRLRNVVTQ
jgi:hypothetical protein